MKLTHFSLCSGIGGLDLAAEWAGFETIVQCEIDEYASKVLAKNFPGVPNLHDIRTVTNERLAEYGIDQDEITVISAGFPCQPYSLAGKGLGDRDDRDLWGEVARIVGEIRPRWFVGENTPGLYARSNQRYFRRVLDDLAAMGYSIGWGIWGACDVGAPHKRDRVFLVAYADGDRRGIFQTDGKSPCGTVDAAKAKTSVGTGFLCGKPRGGAELSGDVHHADGIGRGTDKVAKQCAFQALDQEGRGDKSCGADCISRNVSDADGSGQQECWLQRIASVQPAQVHSSVSYSDGDGKQQQERQREEIGQRACDDRKNVSYATGYELGMHGSAGKVKETASGRRDHGSRAQSYVGWKWWETEPDVGRVADGVSHRVDRLRCLGNAVVPQQAYPIFRAIADYEQGEKKDE